MNGNFFSEFAERLRQAGSSEAAIRAFEHNYKNLVGGGTGMMPEGRIRPVAELPEFESLPEPGPEAGALLSQSLVMKLNGGLGTGMGLERAKSLLEVKDGLTFLDFIARQILYLREQHKVPLRFMVMNSFSTSRDTLEFLAKYQALGPPASVELMQGQVPKVDANTMRPVSWPENPSLEWCPPGHGDIYPSLLGSGCLDRLLSAGMKYMFVSNSDNLGASLDLRLLKYFSESGLGFLMEVAVRTPSDRKGGHLARSGDKFLLRESAQCPESDMDAFQDIQRHRFFNTNNLWLRLDHLRELLQRHGGFLPLPMIRNAKTVDPRQKQSTPVIQLETAMGAAIECFDRSGAVVVPRSRFAPVKTTSDLLGLRSDAYRVTSDWRVVLDNENNGLPPTIDLDPNYFRLVDQLETSVAAGVPSLKACRELKVRGPVTFQPGNRFVGKVAIENPGQVPRLVPAGSYADTEVSL